MTRLSRLAMKIINALDPDAFRELAESQDVCGECLHRGIVRHRTPDYHTRHARQKTDLNICIVIVLLSAVMLGVSWRTQWKRSVWRFLPGGVAA